MKTVLIVEDHEETQEWIGGLVQTAFPSARITTENTVERAIASLRASTYSLALIDINLPDGCGTEVVKYISKNRLNTYQTMMTMYEDDRHIAECFKHGAHGYLVKDQPEARIINSLKQISLGIPPISPSVARSMISTFQDKTEAITEDMNTTAILSPREKEVLILIAKGCSRNEISGYLNLSPNTVSGYTKSIYQKLEVSNRSEATAEAIRSGLAV